MMAQAKKNRPFQRSEKADFWVKWCVLFFREAVTDAQSNASAGHRNGSFLYVLCIQTIHYIGIHLPCILAISEAKIKKLG
jgi:hypothetical protein